MTRSTARYGWTRDLPDHRDLRYAAGADALPDSIDLRASFPPVYDQGQLGSCTGNACAAALAYARTMQGLAAFTPSRLMLYYDARALEGTTAADAGAQIRDVIKGAAQSGACPEGAWPYDPAQFAAKPPPEAYAAALQDRAVGYRRVDQTEAGFESCLAGGDPVVFGFSVYESFESDAVAQSGLVPMPDAREALIGGHAVVAVGYDHVKRQFIVRNSWGAAWGLGGYALFPYDYLLNSDLAADFWAVRLVTP